MAAVPKRRRDGKRKYSIVVSTGAANKLQANHQKLWFPAKTDKETYINTLKELVKPLTDGLKKFYENVEIKVVNDPPDMSNLDDWGTFKLSAKGFSGHTRLADVGGVPYIVNPKYHHITYQLPDIVKTCGLEFGLVFGAGAASPIVVGKIAELMPNTLVPGPRNTQFAKMDVPRNDDDDDDENNDTVDSKNDSVKTNNNDTKNDSNSNDNTDNNASGNDNNNTDDSKNDDKNDGNIEKPFVGIYPSEETGCLANLFISDGKKGPLLYLKVSKRKGDKGLNVAENIKDVLNDYRKKNNIKEQIGMGGLIKVNNGKIKAHIMPNFPKEILDTDEKVTNWLSFHEMGPNLVMFSCLLTGDPTDNDSMHLRLEHTHFHSIKKHCHEGGHYHNDISSDVEYEGYFNLAEYIYRVEDATYNIAQESSS